MRFTKWASVVGFCASSILSSYANAADPQWIVNCESNLCLDATADGIVKVSDCKSELNNQGWNANTPKDKNIGNNGNSKCLDFEVDGGVVKTNDCNEKLEAQNWKFVPNPDGSPIENEFKSGECLLGKGKDDEHVELGPCDATKPQQYWKWVKVGDDPNKACVLPKEDTVKSETVKSETVKSETVKSE